MADRVQVNLSGKNS